MKFSAIQNNALAGTRPHGTARAANKARRWPTDLAKGPRRLTPARLRLMSLPGRSYALNQAQHREGCR